MCFTIPKKISTINGSHATIEDGSIVDISCIQNISVGDFILCTAGIAIARLSPEEGINSRILIKQTHEELH